MDKNDRIRRAILAEMARFQRSGMGLDVEIYVAFLAGLSIGSHLVARYREAGQVLVEFLNRDLLEVSEGNEGVLAQAELDAGVKRLADALPRLD